MNASTYQHFIPNSTKKVVITIFGMTTLLFGIFYMAKHKYGGYREEKINPEFAQYISAYTSGYVTSNSKIRVVLNQSNPEKIEINKPVDNDLFKFSPDIKGEMVWVDQNIVEFHPKNKLKNGESYEVKFKLGEVNKVKSDLKTFRFMVHTIPQSLELNITDITPSGNTYNISGTLNSADQCEKEDLEKSLIANLNGEEKKINWVHENSTTHTFTINGVSRDAESSNYLYLNYNAEKIGGDQTGETSIEIPSKKDFKVIKINIKNGLDQQATVFLSDNVSNKNLEGLLTLEDNNEANISVEGNKILIFPTLRLQGDKKLTLSPEISSKSSKKLGGTTTFSLAFEALKPEIRFNGKGNIIPASDKILLPFEAVNISAVDIKIKRIYEKNILQFLQVNNLDGAAEMNRVGTVVLNKKIPLNSIGTLPKDKWQNYALDLSTLIRTEPGAIYNVSLNFRKEYSICDCYGDSSSVSGVNYTNTLKSESDESDDEKDWENFSEDYEYFDYENYDYEQRENPCNPSYYTADKTINRNIISTNTALVAKRGNDGTISVMTSDIISASPIGGVEVEAYDFQQVLLDKTTTNSNGIGQLKTKKKPFVLMAKNGLQRTFVKMDDGSSLSMSMFEVEGEEIRKGMKGFIYGERGIWRPGDSLYLTFILENKKEELPENFPVTMELLNPQGQVFQKITKTEGTGGFYNFSTRTESYSPTGTWLAKVRAGGAVFTKNIRIETIMPNRLKLNLDFKTDVLKLSDEINGDLQVNWLHGAPGRNLNTKVDVLITKGKTEFKGFKDYVFENSSSGFYSESQTIFSGRTDESGFVKVRLALSNMTQAPGFMNANFTVRGFEEGGAFSTDRFSLPVSPFKEYVGIKSPKANVATGYLYTGTNHRFELANVTEEGKPVSGNVQVKIYKLNWRWWWDDVNDDLSSYMSTEVHTPVFDNDFDLTNGKGNFNFKVESQEWGRYLVVAKNLSTGHTTSDIIFLDWPAWEGKSPKGNEGVNFLGVSTDKSEYNINDVAKIHFPTSEGTKAFITVENGSRVVKSFWADTEKDSTNAWLNITEDMTPNVYVYVTLIQPHKQVINDLPIRLYGVASIKVNDPSKVLHPKITSPDVWKPELETYVRVSETEGKEMTYTLAVVDEGLLDITRFKTPDPYSAFNSKEALGVKTWDVFDQVMGANAGGIQRILAIGGDANLNAKEEIGAKRFIPMVRYLGPFHLDKGEIKTHQIKVPQYVGSVRVMVVAGYENGYGKDEKTIAVRKPLMILSTLPRVLGPGEEVDLPVTVFAMENKVKNVKLSVNPGNSFELVDAPSKNISFTNIGDQVVNFRLRVKETCGWGSVKITAEGGGEISKEEINIEVRSPNP
ncbi:MAG: alpha-2-macroglobulin family protein, partial [Bacteroidota bacterium]